MPDKFEIFLSVCSVLNRSLSLCPLLFGSLGLERRLGKELGAQDVDILVPERFLGEDWPLLVREMERMGFCLYDLHEHAFCQNGVSVAFASLESLWPFAGVDPKTIPQAAERRADYLLLTAEDYLKVYLASSKDSYRADKNNHKDLEKIALLREHLGV